MRLEAASVLMAFAVGLDMPSGEYQNQTFEAEALTAALVTLSTVKAVSESFFLAVPGEHNNATDTWLFGLVNIYPAAQTSGCTSMARRHALKKKPATTGTGNLPSPPLYAPLLPLLPPPSATPSPLAAGQ
jgi:hypothetical protein